MSLKQPLRILITNDDGINAPGIQILENIARQLTDDVWVVAPDAQQSGKGHSLTFRDPLRLTKVGEQKYSVDGTPTDCVILALRKVLSEKRPDFVLSGINEGENVGESLTQSGTVGAAMEATIHGVKAIALSQVSMESYPTDWTIAEKYGLSTIEHILKLKWGANTLFNVNFPRVKENEVEGLKYVRTGRRSQMGGMVECLDPRGHPYYWVGVLHTERDAPEDTDLWAILNNYIAVTPVSMDLTCHHSLSTCKDSPQLIFKKDLAEAS